ncbi:hypothetical protein [Polynucleobacter sp. UB-Raua-W9]|jgi:hypothetical protein|uniref:hypothetical protein n=1 Tax=Polynucleobacter sp. UB-Raua-W9 TaxID=1819736 RepID=UPI001BFE56D8|nr:hypothetical protein [Polynucleobacter sp. UB-Raua-W9]QWD72709.1 hypothetical protein AOC07_01610 [Polynucleobacter sp. UB-Raua-W9]
MNLLAIGNSPKLIQFVQSIFPVERTQIIAWRSLPIDSCQTKAVHEVRWDIILIAGYDYASAGYRYEQYLAKNVDRVMDIVQSSISQDSRVIYINTLSPKKQATYSRYLYAKMLLGLKLVTTFPNVDLLEFPTIEDCDSGQPSISGGMLSVLAFRVLRFFGFLSTVMINNSQSENRSLFDALKRQPSLPSPRFLEIPRSLMIDRLLRLIIG